MEAGGEATALIEEMEHDARVRQERVEQLRENLNALVAQEADLQQRVAALQETKPEVAEAFTEYLRKDLDTRERSNVRRDWVIFSLGILVSAAVSFILSFF